MKEPNFWIAPNGSVGSVCHEAGREPRRFQSLKTRFDDVSLTRMFYEANKAPDSLTAFTITRVNELKQAQIMDWMTKRKTVDDVLRLLKLDEDGARTRL